MKTIEINNKHYIDAKVVMLATDKESNISLVHLNNNTIHKLIFNKDNIKVELSHTNKHLYITSNEEIKSHDYFLFKDEIHRANYIENNRVHSGIYSFSKNGINKIIASTDESLKLSQPSKEFIQLYIESYNKGEVITDVLVEIEEIYKFPDGKRSYHGDVMCANKTGEFELKLKDNTIIIKEKEEDWDDILNKFNQYYYPTLNKGTLKTSGNQYTEFAYWLKENYHPPIKK